MKLTRLLLVCLAALLFGSAAARAHVNTNGTAEAIGGYDAVAYFSDGKPVRGVAAHAFSWRGARWLFASAEHRERFAAAPERYAPAYGGYCAYAAADGRLVKTDPNAWHVAGGRLFLNYSLEIRARWLADQARYIKLADEKWPALAATAR
jgi:YHS domain-containing protein